MITTTMTITATHTHIQTHTYVPPVYVSSYLPMPSTSNASGLEFLRRPLGSKRRNKNKNKNENEIENKNEN